GRADVQKGRHVLRGGGPVACVLPLVTEFVTLLADFVTHSIGLTGCERDRAGRLMSLDCNPSVENVLAIGELASATRHGVRRHEFARVDSYGRSSSKLP